MIWRVYLVDRAIHNYTVYLGDDFHPSELENLVVNSSDLHGFEMTYFKDCMYDGSHQLVVL